jgi:hypothetical protein
MFDDLTRSVKEAVSDTAQGSDEGFFQNVMRRFKGRLLFSLVFFLVFGAAAIGIILMIVFFVLKSI